MDIGNMISELKSQADQISCAIAALTGIGSPKAGWKRGPVPVEGRPGRKGGAAD